MIATIERTAPSSTEGGQAMMRPRRFSVIAALSLLAWTATASAECAWALWQKTFTVLGEKSSESWSSESGWKTKEECEPFIDRRLARFRNKPSNSMAD